MLRPLPLQDGAWNHSAATQVAVAGTPVNALGANPQRRGCGIKNNSLTTRLWLRVGADATTAEPSIPLEPGQTWETPPGGAPAVRISVNSTLAGHAFSAWDWNG